MKRIPTDEQNAILDCPGNIVVTAKPGSGKTFTVVEKIARILPLLPDYKGVIAISYTNKASDELKQRCRQRCTEMKQSFFGTLDKFYISQIIIPFACHITMKNPEYEILNELPDDEEFSTFINNHWPLTNREETQLINELAEGKIYLPLTGETALTILNNVPGVMVYLKARYSHIFIDEYQDCGELQNQIFTRVVDNGITGIAVGDINQAIFGFANRFPEYLISLIGRKGFTHFELSKNHRCHPGIEEYSLCLLGASKDIPTEKRVFRVTIQGDEQKIAAAIDTHIDEIKKRYNVNNNNRIAILCRTNSGASRIAQFLSTPYKQFEETLLDKDNSEWGRLFRSILIARFEEIFYAPDYAEELFSEEYEPQKYRIALSLCQSIFSCDFDRLASVEKGFEELATLVYPQKRNCNALENLKAVLCTPELLRNYVPATNDELNLMTLHKSKGLEFNIVFHLDLYKWILPNEYGSDGERLQDLNLHYVGITRAMDACYILNGTQRFRSKNRDFLPAVPSPFLEISGTKERRIEITW